MISGKYIYNDENVSRETFWKISQNQNNRENHIYKLNGKNEKDHVK